MQNLLNTVNLLVNSGSSATILPHLMRSNLNYQVASASDKVLKANDGRQIPMLGKINAVTIFCGCALVTFLIPGLDFLNSLNLVECKFCWQVLPLDNNHLGVKKIQTLMVWCTKQEVFISLLGHRLRRNSNISLPTSFTQ